MTRLRESARVILQSIGVGRKAAIPPVVAAMTMAVLCPAALAQGSFDWRSDWAAEDGFTLTIDTDGYELPTAMAFVPRPGKGPKDPLYFVTELRGAVKVVTNDGTVLPFARVNTLRPSREAPEFEGQAGLGGICLDADHGYVFVTFAYRDSDGILRNSIVRFSTSPASFDVRPTGRISFGSIFAPYRAGVAHQIGACQVVDGTLFVSIGDGWDPASAQRRDVLLGKVLRMTLAGKPVEDNPFAHDRPDDPASYVWAYGFRNPFGLKAVGDALFATHNGPGVDSFLRIERGRNYLWDGSDWSIATGADAVFTPSLSPVHLDYLPTSATLFPAKYRDAFFLAASGHGPFRASPGPPAGILALPYDLEQQRNREPARYFVRYQGNGTQLVAGLAFGPDGLYFAPLLPNQSGQTPVIRVGFDLATRYPYVLGRESGGFALIQDKGCLSCHELNGQGSTVAPSLDFDSLKGRLTQRLFSEEYLRALRSQSDPATEQERAAVLSAQGYDRHRVWVKTQILSPGFDNPSSQMPNLGLTEREADAITAYLVGVQQAEGTQESGLRGLATRVYRKFFGEPSPRGAAIVGLAVGLGLGVVLILGAFGAWRLMPAGKSTRLSGSRGKVDQPSDDGP